AFGVNNAMYNTTYAGVYFDGPTQVYTATNDIADLIRQQPNDVRNYWIGGEENAWQIKKFPSNVVPGFNNPAGSFYQTIIRSSELYLNAAESYAKLDIPDSARYFLDAVRLRADSTAVASASLE